MTRLIVFHQENPENLHSPLAQTAQVRNSRTSVQAFGFVATNANYWTEWTSLHDGMIQLIKSNQIRKLINLYVAVQLLFL